MLLIDIDEVQGRLPLKCRPLAFYYFELLFEKQPVQEGHLTLLCPLESKKQSSHGKHPPCAARRVEGTLIAGESGTRAEEAA